MKISLLIPMYNEQANLPLTLPAVTSYMKQAFGDGYEILLINDGSTDDSAALVSAFGDPAIRLLSYSENRGKGYAIRYGVKEALGEVIVFTDCDLAYGCEVIGDLAALLREENGPDVVIGSRPLHPDGYAGYTLLRRLASKSYRAVLRLFGGLRLSDSQCGCKGFRGEMAKRIFSYCEVDRFAFDFEAILIGEKLGARFREMPVTVKNHGESKVRVVRDTFRMLRDLRRMRKRIRRLDVNKTI